MSSSLAKALFIVAGIYEGLLGLAFLTFPLQIFERFAVEAPNHLGYVQFPALLLVVFAWMFFKVASDPARYRELIPYGCGLKMSYCGLVFYYDMSGGIPAMWIPFAWADLAFLVLFVLAWTGTRSELRAA